MDRRTALDLLEVVRPDANDLHDADFAKAAAFLQTDEPGRAIFAQRQEADRQIAEAMQRVSIPLGLRERLLAAVAEQAGETNAVTSSPADLSRPPERSSRRWFLSALVVTASGLLAMLGWWLFQSPPETLLTLDQLKLEAPYTPEELRSLPAFAGAFEPTVPDGTWLIESQFAFSSPPKGFAPLEDGLARVAVYEFQFRDPRERPGRIFRGVLLVVPQTELAAIPESLSYLGGPYSTIQAKPRVAIRAWSEREFVYLCFVDIDDHESLSRALDVPSA